MVLFEKYEKERSSAKRLNAKAKEIESFLAKLEKEKDELEEA